MDLKLPHWAQLALGLAALVVSWLIHQQSSGALDLPAGVMAALTMASTALGLVSGSALSGKAAKPAGFARIDMLLVLVAVGAIGCAWFKANAKPLEQDAAKLASCVLTEFAKAPDAFDPVQTAIVCGAQSAEQVMQIVGAHKSAEAKEGLHK